MTFKLCFRHSIAQSFFSVTQDFFWSETATSHTENRILGFLAHIFQNDSKQQLLTKHLIQIFVRFL